LGFDTDRDADRRRKSDLHSESDPAQKLLSKKKKGVATGDVGGALRSVYQRTIDEQIPPDLLDLLGKLG
jgi:hypothetical protein